jgi:hypothetical protein
LGRPDAPPACPLATAAEEIRGRLGAVLPGNTDLEGT